MYPVTTHITKTNCTNQLLTIVYSQMTSFRETSFRENYPKKNQLRETIPSSFKIRLLAGVLGHYKAFCTRHSWLVVLASSV